MLCRKPFVKAGVPFPCGQCMPCRITRRKTWAARIMLESLCHANSAFLTLTYSDDNLPMRDGLAVLVPDHMQLFLKRMRRAVEPSKLRFYGVGEYGDNSFRPHFHIVLFGFRSCARGSTLKNPVTKASRWADCCDACRMVGNTWGLGDVFLGGVTRDTSSYVAEYTVKKMTAHDDVRLGGRSPEFCRMSLRPGIGADAMWDVASTLLHYSLDERLVDVPNRLGSGTASMPLGRYLRSKLRVMIGKDGGAPEEVLKQMAEEMRPLREAAFASSSSFAQAIVDDGAQAVANIEARMSIHKKGKWL